MHYIRPILIGLLLACTAAAAPLQSPGRWERQFPETVSVLVLQNTVGRTEVEVVAAPTIHVAADGGPGETLDASTIIVDESAPGVLIVRVNGSATAHLRVAIPARTVLSVQSATGEITVRGVAARLLAETQAGNVVLHLPAGLDAEFSFKTTTGQVLAGVALAETAGNTAPKGRPVVHARSGTGNIVLLPLTGPPASVPPPDPAGVAPLTPVQQRLATRAALRRTNRPVVAEPRPITLTSRSAAAAKKTSSHSTRLLIRMPTASP